MSHYYLVSQAKTTDGVTAQVPDGVSWVGQPVEVPPDLMVKYRITNALCYVIKTTVAIPRKNVLQEFDPTTIAEMCERKGIPVPNVLYVWAIGGEA